MFSSNDYNYFHYIMPGEDHQNPNLLPEYQHPSPSLHFQVPFLDDDDDQMLMTQLFSSQQPISESNLIMPPIPNTTPPTKEATKKVKVASLKRRSINDGAKVVVPRKRTGKKDRHSKIYTSKGPRDRRMRLSLQIARKFFHLQDMLGFDKASKTIEWLFAKSKSAIQEITDNFAKVKENCNDGCEKTLPTILEGEILSLAKEIEENGEPNGVKEKRERKSTLKGPMNVSVPKESREKARARARERTREKMKMKSNQNLMILEDSIPEQEMECSISIIEKFLGITSTTCEEDYPVLIENIDKMQMEYSYGAMTNHVKELSGNVVQVQNPNSIFMDNTSIQEQNPSSVFIEENEFCINNDVNYQQMS